MRAWARAGFPVVDPHGAPWLDRVSALVLALAAGAVVGLALGALGGGGGVLAVPALVYLLGFSPVDAATASLLIVAVTSATALYGHARDGRVRWAARRAVRGGRSGGRQPWPGALADGVPRRALTAAFAAVAVLAAVRMLRGRPPAADGDARRARTAGTGRGRRGRRSAGSPASSASAAASSPSRRSWASSGCACARPWEPASS